MAKKKQKLPFGVGCLAILILLGSLTGIALAVTYILHKTGNPVSSVPKELWSTLESQSKPTLYLSFVQAAIAFPMAIGLLCRKFWAYCLYTIFNGFALGLCAVQVFMWHQYLSIAGLLFNTLILIYVFLPGVRKVFN